MSLSDRQSEKEEALQTISGKTRRHNNGRCKKPGKKTVTGSV